MSSEVREEEYRSRMIREEERNKEEKGRGAREQRRGGVDVSGKK